MSLFLNYCLLTANNNRKYGKWCKRQTTVLVYLFGDHSAVVVTIVHRVVSRHDHQLTGVGVGVIARTKPFDRCWSWIAISCAIYVNPLPFGNKTLKVIRWCELRRAIMFIRDTYKVDQRFVWNIKQTRLFIVLLSFSKTYFFVWKLDAFCMIFFNLLQKLVL